MNTEITPEQATQEAGKGQFTTPFPELNRLLDATFDLGAGVTGMDMGLYWYDCFEEVKAMIEKGQPSAFVRRRGLRRAFTRKKTEAV